MKTFLLFIMCIGFNLYSMEDSQIERYKTSLYAIAEIINDSCPRIENYPDHNSHPLAAPFIEISDKVETSWNTIPANARRLIVGSLVLLTIQIKKKMMTQVEDPKQLEEDIDPYINVLQDIENEIFKECNGL